MNLQSAISIQKLCYSLHGKVYRGQLMCNVFVAPAQREPKLMMEMINNFLSGNELLNGNINERHEYFDVFVLFKKPYHEIDEFPYTVTTVQELLPDIINSLPKSHS